jgi:uncharacterized protein YciI
MDAHTLVLLMRPAEPPQLDTDAVDALQEQHLAFLQARRDEGLMAAAGPFRDRPDERWRGMCIYLVDRERALELASEDPMVRAGWLELLALTWLSRPGDIRAAFREGNRGTSPHSTHSTTASVIQQ